MTAVYLLRLNVDVDVHVADPFVPAVQLIAQFVHRRLDRGQLLGLGGVAALEPLVARLDALVLPSAGEHAELLVAVAVGVQLAVVVIYSMPVPVALALAGLLLVVVVVVVAVLAIVGVVVALLLPLVVRQTFRVF